MQPVVTGAVEGDLDEAVLRRVLGDIGITLGLVHGRKGKAFLLQCLPGYNNAANFAPWVVLIDLDQDCVCATSCLRQWLHSPAPQMCFRVAVRSIEAWLLADRERVARLLGIRTRLIPTKPDDLDDPKRELISLARRSSRRSVREELVPRDGSGRAVGPLYTTRMIEFVMDKNAGWRPEEAARISYSLSRCLQRLSGIFQ